MCFLIWFFIKEVNITKSLCGCNIDSIWHGGLRYRNVGKSKTPLGVKKKSISQWKLKEFYNFFFKLGKIHGEFLVKVSSKGYFHNSSNLI